MSAPARTNWWTFWLVRVPCVWGSAWLLGALLDVEWSWTGAIVTVAVLIIIELAWPSRSRRKEPERRAPVELAPGQAHVVVAVTGPPRPRWLGLPEHRVIGEVVISAPVGELHMGLCEDRLVVLDDGRSDSVVLEIADWRSKVIHGGALGMAVRMRG